METPVSHRERVSTLEIWAFKAGYLAGRQQEHPAPEALSRWLLTQEPASDEDYRKKYRRELTDAYPAATEGEREELIEILANMCVEHKAGRVSRSIYHEADEILALLSQAPEQGERTLYVARCGWCGAYEGTVDGLCEDSLDGGDSQIGLHQFDVFELLHPEPEEADDE